VGTKRKLSQVLKIPYGDTAIFLLMREMSSAAHGTFHQQPVLIYVNANPFLSV